MIIKKYFLVNNIESVYELYYSLLIKKCILNHSLGKSPEIVEFRRNAQHCYKTRSKVKGKLNTLRPKTSYGENSVSKCLSLVYTFLSSIDLLPTKKLSIRQAKAYAKKISNSYAYDLNDFHTLIFNSSPPYLPRAFCVKISIRALLYSSWS